MMVVLNLLVFIFTFFIGSDIAFLTIRRYLKDDDHLSDIRLFFLTRGVGPILISWLQYNLLLFFPHQPTWLYICSVFAIYGLLFFWGKSELPRLRMVYTSLYQRFINNIQKLSPQNYLLLGVSGLAVIFILIIAVAFPIVAHDSLAFAIESRIMVRDHSLESYLSINAPDPQTGYYLQTFQIPFLQVLYAWFFMITGTSDIDILARTVSPMYAIYSLVLLGYVLYRRKSFSSAIWAVFLLAVTPLFVIQGYDNSQDPPRLYFAFLALVWFAELIEADRSNHKKLAVIVGLFAGFAFYAHVLGAPIIVVGLLLYLLLARQTLWRKLGALVTVSGVVLVAGATYHYFLNMIVMETFLKQFSLGFIYEWLLLLKPDFAPPASSQIGSTQFASYLEARGQGETPWMQFIFGRMQMLTGIEYFGWLYYFFWLALVVWLWRWKKTTLDKLLLIAALFYIVLVLSGVRKVSWANPRYIGSTLLMGAYFAGLLMPALVNLAPAPLKRKIIALGLVLILVFPVTLVVTIRGAKVGITNSGSFYSDFRSLSWVDYAIEQPFASISYMWENYIGIKRTVRYFFANDKTKLANSHDFLAAVEYINTQTDQDAYPLVFRDGRYFYYAEKAGIIWYDPRIYPDYALSESKSEVNRILTSAKVNYVVTDDYFNTHPAYADTKLVDLLNDRDYSQLVYTYGSAKVYKLISPSLETMTDE